MEWKLWNGELYGMTSELGDKAPSRYTSEQLLHNKVIRSMTTDNLRKERMDKWAPSRRTQQTRVVLCSPGRLPVLHPGWDNLDSEYLLLLELGKPSQQQILYNVAHMGLTNHSRGVPWTSVTRVHILRSCTAAVPWAPEAPTAWSVPSHQVWFHIH